MVTCLIASLLALSPPQQTDTATFRDAAVAELYARARVRHIRQDSLVRDYRALVRTRMDVTAGRSRFGRQTALFAHETAAQVQWRSPNDLKVNVLGSRSAAPVLRMAARMAGESATEVDEELREDFRQEVFLDRPWFVPRALNDSVRLMGVPERAALHPLGDGATSYYRFSVTDSVRMRVPGRDVQAVKVRVEPKQLGPSLVAGEMWLDRETGDVVRLAIVFVGEYVWEQPKGATAEDSARAREDNRWATRFVSAEADIEYALIENRYWLPFRQLLAMTLEIPWFLNATVPGRAVSTFSDYEVNSSPAFDFAVPLDDLGDSVSSDPLSDERTRVRVRATAGEQVGDPEHPTNHERYEHGYHRAGTWGGGRWEVEVPGATDLAGYAWEREFEVSLDPHEENRLRESIVVLAELSEDLPDEWVGRTRFGIAWEEFADFFRFNRVQGPSLGLGYHWRPGPDFTTVQATARYGFSDQRPTGFATWRRDGPGGRLDLTAYRTMKEVEPWTRGLGIGNSLNGIFAGNDDADYYLALGGGMRYQWNGGLLRDVEFEALVERQRSVTAASDAPVPDLFGSGAFQANPPVIEGDFFSAGVARTTRVGFTDTRLGLSLLVGEGLLAARAWTRVTIPVTLAERTGTVTLRAGAVGGDALPQVAFRIGGLQTVRGHTYGSRTGREFWSAQFDMALGRSSLWTPVVFADAGDTFSSNPLYGVGAGFSALNGLVRFGVSKGLNPSTDLRFDLMFRAPR